MLARFLKKKDASNNIMSDCKMNTDDNEIIVVYNKFSCDCVIAAAVLKSHGFFVIDNTKNIPTTGTKYIWLGIEHNTFGSEIYHILKDKNHVYYKEQQEISAEINYFDGMLSNTISVFEQVSKDFCEDDTGTLGNSLVKFNTNKLTERDLQYIFVNLRKATEVLNGDGLFVLCKYLHSDKTAYEAFIRDAKYKLKGGYGLQYVSTSNGYVKTAVTYMNDGCHLALRMIRLAHHNYANISVTANGCMIDTNLHNIHGLEFDGKIIHSNMM